MTTFRFDNSLEGLIELTESSYTHGYGVLPVKDTNLYSLREELHTAESRKLPAMKLQVFSLWNSGQCYFPFKDV